jgi:hypothetical protein
LQASQLVKHGGDRISHGLSIRGKIVNGIGDPLRIAGVEMVEAFDRMAGGLTGVEVEGHEHVEIHSENRVITPETEVCFS